MSGSRWIAAAVRKDLRALAPASVLCAIAMAAGQFVLGATAGFAAYLLGSTLLGALVIGHEYSSHTLSGLLTMPVPRGQIYAVKLVVLVPMLVALGAVAFWTGATGVALNWWTFNGRSVEALDPLLTLLLPPLCALCLAPLFTMVGRSAMAGAVFAFAALSMVWFASEVLGIARFGLAPADVPRVNALRAILAWYGTLGLCVAGAVASWWTFARLQAHDGRSLTISLPPWLTVSSLFQLRGAPPPRSGSREPTSPGSQARGIPHRSRRHWVLSAARKELRLHSLNFVIAALYVVFWYAVVLARPAMPVYLQLPSAFFTSIFGCVVGVLIGSLASAEERQLGTAAWQGLLPVAASRQWVVKVAMVIGLALALGVGLPMLLVQSVPGRVTWNLDFVPESQLPLVLALAAGSLYVSSLCASGLRAVMTSMAAVGCVTVIARPVAELLARAGFLAGFPVLRRLGWYPLFDKQAVVHEIALNARHWFPGLCVAVLAGCLIRFAMTNHRSDERGTRLVVRQSGWMTLFIALACLSGGVVDAATARSHWFDVGSNGVSVSGRIEFDGGSARPTAEDMRQRLYVMLERAPREPGEFVPGRVSPDGTFVTAGAFPGAYVVRVSWTAPSWSKGWTFKSATWHGRDVAEAPLDLSASASDVVVTLTDHPGALTGRVEGASGPSMVAKTVVFLFSVNRDSWSDYNAHIGQRVRTAAPDVNGEFTFTMPPDGEYYLIAVPRDRVAEILPKEPLWVDIQRNPAPVFEMLAPLAEKIQARMGETIARTLRIVAF